MADMVSRGDGFGVIRLLGTAADLESEPLPDRMKARVRGIHSTAATRLLLDSGFTVVDPSEIQSQRFAEELPDEPPDVYVEDTEDYRGLVVSGDSEAADDVASALGEEGWTWSADLGEGEVFDADVVETLAGGAVVSGDDGEAFLPYGRVDSHVEEGDEVMVQVVEAKAPWNEGLPVVEAGVRVGDVVGFRRGGSGVEVEGGDEADHVQMQRTLDLVDFDAPDGWTPCFRRDALEMSSTEVAEALEYAAEDAREMERKLDEGSGDGGVDSIWIWPGPEGRRRFDEARDRVVSTVDGHHRLKAYSKTAADAVDFLEAADVDLGGFQFEAAADAFGPEEGDTVEILHGKPSGAWLRLGDAEVVDVEGSTVVLEREMSAGGEYDGFGAEKERGDVARTELREGEQRYVTTYLSSDGDVKGSYVNVSTPVEVYPDAVVYVDLYVDAVHDAESEEVSVVDEDELKDAVERGYVEEETAEVARGLAEEAAEELGN